jgi:hypothetical protein
MELARTTLPSGEVVRFEEVQGADKSWCLTRGNVGQETSSCFGLGPARPTVTGPQFTGPPAGPGFFTILLPAGFASNVTVRDAEGALVPSARSSDGTVLLILDPAGRTNGPPTSRPARSFDLVAGDGAVAGRVTTPGYSATPGAPATDARIETAACLRAQGLAVPDLTTGPASVVPYPPQAAQAAWQACRDAYARASGVPASAMAQALVVPDCMAAQGWLIVVMSGPPTDIAAYNTAMQKCGVSSGSGPSYRAEVVACLRAQGLEVVEPSPGSASGVASPRYPPDAAQRAWQACRDTYARDAGIPTSALAQALLVPDCMAAQGWLIVVMSGPPTDASAFNTAMQKCR